MAIGAFPLIKLGALALRQISKPLANHLKTRAKSSEFLRTKICIPAGQFYHRCEINVKARLLNLGRPKEVVNLNEQAAIDLGSELIGEMFMFTIAATTVIIEYNRQSRKYADEKFTLESRLQKIESQNRDLETLCRKIETRLSEVDTKHAEVQRELDQLIVKRKK